MSEGKKEWRNEIKKWNEGRKEGGGREEMILKNKTLYGFFTGSILCPQTCC